MRKIFVVIGFGVLLGAQGAFASGFSKPVLIGPKAIGMGGAFVGLADDPTAIFHNVAGITQLKGHQIQLGIDGLITDEHHTPTGATSEEDAKTEFLPVPNFFYATDILKPAYIGLGVYFPHGNGGKYDTASVNPFNPLEGRIYSMEIAPAVALQLTPELSAGFTIRAVRVSTSLKGQATALGVALNDLDLTGWGYGFSTGLLYKPCKAFSWGLDYRSQIRADLSGDVELATLGTFDSDLEQILPAILTTGVAVHPIEGLTVGLSFDWEKNAEIDTLVLEVAPPIGPVPVPENFDDSYTIHIGADYRVMPALSVRAGYAKDLNDSIPDAVINRVIGDIAAHEVSVGAAYEWGRYTFSGTWNGRFGERDVANTGTNIAPGHYEAFVHSVSVAVGISL